MKPVLPLALVLSCAPVWAQNALTVRVVDAAGAPVPNAQIQVRAYVDDMTLLAPKTTGANGAATFTMPKNPAGKITAGEVLVGAPGFAFASATAMSDKLEVELGRGAVWRGKVVDEAGKPLSGATISLQGVSAPMERFTEGIYFFGEAIPKLYSATSGADGSFGIEGAPVGKDLRFRVTRPGYVVVNGQDGRAGNDAAIPLVRGGSLRGRVLDVSGKPLAKIEVFASAMGMGSGGHFTATDASGAFTIDHLAAGIYRVTARAGKSAPYILPRLSNARVEVGKTGEIGPIRAQTGVLIRGVVRDALTKKPIARASFAAQRPTNDNTDDAWSSSDATGHFALRVLPGKYQVRSSGAPAGFLRSEKIQTVAVGATAPAELVFALQKAPIIRGVTVDENDKPFEARFTVGDHIIQMGSGKDGKWQYQPSDNGDLTFGGGSDENGYFEVIEPKRLDTPVRGPITLQMRKKPWQTLAGRAVTPEGAPVAGVKIEASFIVMFSDSSGWGATSNATTDAEGRFVLEKLRDSRDLKVSGKGANYQFVSGGAITKKGANWTVSDLVFAPLAGKIEGTTEAGALVTTAGRETRADDAGHFAFESLPVGQNLIYAAKSGRGGSTSSSASPLVITLQKPELQGRDETLAREIWAETLRDAGDPDASGLDDWLAPLSFDDAMKAAQKSGDANKIAEVAARWKSGDSLELLQSGLDLVTSPDARTDAYLRAALVTGDAALGRRALEIADATFQTATDQPRWREEQLYRAAVLNERLNGAAAGQLALGRALAMTLKNHPQKSKVEGAMQTQIGRNEALADAASIVAQGSPALVRELLDNIDDESAFQIRAFANAIPVLAKTHGLDAALPFLDELQKKPAPTLDNERRYLTSDPDFAYGQAVHDLMPVAGAKSPALAVELAKRVEGDEQRARALASAAKFQKDEVAAPLLREAVAKIGSEDAPRVAAFVWGRDPKLGLELFEVARQKAEDEMRGDFPGRNAWVSLAFGMSRADPAQARLILEREWAKGIEAKIDDNELFALAISLAPLDARRALEMARRIAPQDKNNFWSVAAKRRIARFLVADESERQGFTLNRIGSREAWDAGQRNW